MEISRTEIRKGTFINARDFRFAIFTILQFYPERYFAIETKLGVISYVFNNVNYTVLFKILLHPYQQPLETS